MRIRLEHGTWEENFTLHSHPESWKGGLGTYLLEPALAGAPLGNLDTSVIPLWSLSKFRPLEKIHIICLTGKLLKKTIVILNVGFPASTHAHQWLSLYTKLTEGRGGIE